MRALNVGLLAIYSSGLLLLGCNSGGTSSSSVTNALEPQTSLYVLDEASWGSGPINGSWHVNATKVDEVLFGFWATESNGHIYIPRGDLDLGGVSEWPGIAYSLEQGNQIFSDYAAIPNNAMLKGACVVRSLSNYKTKFVISVGGWGRSSNFSQAFSSSEGRQNFIDDSLYILSNFKCGDGIPLFAGIDIDWEYPKQRIDFTYPNVRPDDASNFHSLIIKLRDSIGESPVISIAIPHGNNPANTAESITSDGGRIDNYFTDALGKPLSDNLQFINAMTSFNVMAYDFAAFTPKTTANAPLLNPDAGGGKSIAMGVDNLLLTWNVPSQKISLGLPLYGRSISNQSSGGVCVGANTSNNGLNVDLPPITNDQGQQSPCVIAWPAYKNILVDKLSSIYFYGESAAQYGYYWNLSESGGSKAIVKAGTTYTTEAAPWPGVLLDASSNGYLSIDASNTIEIKTKYALAKNLGGVFFWEASQDADYNSPDIEINGKSYPHSLIHTVNKALGR